jgi:SAM-dependent methyltransferase
MPDGTGLGYDASRVIAGRQRGRSERVSNEQMAPLEERYFVYEQETVPVDDFETSGYVLDVGGGGEGIIGILKGEQVVAIDLRTSELEEAPDGPLKLVMDARDMVFLDRTFHTATAFFSLMYFKSKPDHEQVFREVFRVLRPGGRFLVWDASISRPAETDKPSYVILLRVAVKDQEIETGYGQPWPEETHDPAFYIALAEKAGFQLAERKEDGRLFFLALRKPESPLPGRQSRR